MSIRNKRTKIKEVKENLRRYLILWKLSGEEWIDTGSKNIDIWIKKQERKRIRRISTNQLREIRINGGWVATLIIDEKYKY